MMTSIIVTKTKLTHVMNELSDIYVLHIVDLSELVLLVRENSDCVDNIRKKHIPDN